ncbi:MAG: YifB family Mg chelatase-like AAA ATPase [Burkholderiaceae bacterium]
MSLACIHSRALLGIDSVPVQVEVHVTSGLPAFHIVGLPEAAVRESRDRVRAALLQCGFNFPNRRLTVNLAPADLPKGSGRFDLPIAIGILVASDPLPAERSQARLFMGELSLGGELRPIRGALAMALAVAREASPPPMVMPRANAAEVSRVPHVQIAVAGSFGEVCADLNGEARLPPLARGPEAAAQTPAAALPDLRDVRGQTQAKRALEICAGGGHSLLLVGPPGSGKSMLAQRLPGILPPLSDAEALETGAVASLAGRFDAAGWRTRPFRAPHHSASTAALVGGGTGLRPGEISLAHHGVLFLDELPEFGPRTLDSLREPLETGRIALSRAARQLDLPARFQLVAAMNPCPCGHFGTPRCRCTPDIVRRYQQRLSGPLLDRLDLQLWVGPVTLDSLGNDRPDGDASARVAARVQTARERQLTRQGCVNAVLGPEQIEQWCRLDRTGRDLMLAAAGRLHWSGRVFHRLQKIARTIADLAGEAAINPGHVAQAIDMRRALTTPD